MADHVRVESVKGKASVWLPDGFSGQIVLHCNGGTVLRYNVTEVGRRPASPDGAVEIREPRRRPGR